MISVIKMGILKNYISVVGSGIKGFDNPFGGWKLSESELFLHKGDYESLNLTPNSHKHVVW